MNNGMKIGDESSEMAPIVDLEFLGVPLRVLNLVEEGMKTLWVEDLPHGDKLREKLTKIRMMGPRSVDLFIKGIEEMRKKRCSR